eukprot:m.332535 g.332535  ORF g.332535 m.332535 type:complete len:3185 (-) comp16959_c0_seq1:2670-12224(-)
MKLTFAFLVVFGIKSALAGYLDVKCDLPTPGTVVKAGKNLTAQIWLAASTPKTVTFLLMMKPPNHWSYYEILSPQTTVSVVGQKQVVDIVIPDYIPPDEYWIVMVDEYFSVIGVMPAENVPTSTVNWGTARIIVEEPDPPPSCNNRTALGANAPFGHDACASDEYCSDPYGKCYKCFFCFQDNDAFDLQCPSKCGTSSFKVGDSLPNMTEAAASGAPRSALLPGCPQYKTLVTNLNPMILFDNPTATSNPRLMSPLLNEKLEELHNQVRLRSFPLGTVLHVKSGYEEFVDGVSSSLTLHHEGRALDIGMRVFGNMTNFFWNFCSKKGEMCTCDGYISMGVLGLSYTVPRESSSAILCDESVFGDPLPGTNKEKECFCTTSQGFPFTNGEDDDYETLARIAASPSVGFDWVKLTGKNNIHASVLDDVCETPLDLVFLLDESSSIEEAKYGGYPGTFKNKLIGFVKEVVKKFQFGTGPEHSRIGVATFSNGAREHFLLGEHDSESDILAALDNITHAGGPTHTKTGLELVRDLLLMEQTNGTGVGTRPQSSGIPKVLIVMTDGTSTTGYEPADVAKEIRDINANIFVMGVGDGVNVNELNSMASDPIDSHVYALKAFDQIISVVTSVAASSCSSAAIVESGQTTLTEVGECETRYFAPKCGDDGDTTVTVTTSKGEVHVYISTDTSNPGPHASQYSDESNSTVKTFLITRQSGDVGQLTIGVRGIEAENSFTLDTSRDIFSGVTKMSFDINETVSVTPKCPPDNWNCEYPVSASSPCCNSLLPGGSAGNTPFYCSHTDTVKIGDSGCCAFDVDGAGTQGAWSCLPEGPAKKSPVGVTLSNSITTSLAGFQPTYEISSGDDVTLEVDAGTGEVFLVKPLDYETDVSHSIRVTASDPNFPCLKGYVDIDVNVLNVDDNVPFITTIIPLCTVCTNFTIFTNLPSPLPNGVPIDFTVSEATPPGTELLQVVAMDADQNAGNYTFTFTFTQVVRNRRIVAVGSPFGFNETSGVLYVASVLDSSVGSFYSLLLTIDGGAGSAPAKLVLQASVETANCPTNYFSADGTYPCTESLLCNGNQYESVLATPTSARECEDISSCSLGNTFEVSPPTSTSDRKCEPVSSCNSEQYLVSEAELTQDTDCRNLTKCDASQYILTAASPTSDRVCEAKKSCGNNEYESSPATSSTDRQCSIILSCNSTEYEVQGPTTTSNRVCDSVSQCEQGSQYQLAAATQTSDTVCRPYSTCDSDEFEAVQVTLTSDRDCNVSKICLATEFEVASPTTTTDTVCQSLTVCEADYKESVAPTVTSDRSCEKIDDCVSNLCDQGTCVDGIRSYTCSCTINGVATGYTGKYCDCKDGSTYTPTGDSPCFAYTTCTAAQFESVAPTPSTNRQCLTPKTCQNDQYEKLAPTSTTDRDCQLYSTCDNTQFEVVAKTPTSDRQCEPLLTCNSSQYEATPASSTTNRVCAMLSTCSGDEYQNVPPTLSSDRGCSELTDCENDEYQTKAPTESSNRECSEISVCESDEYETIKPTLTSNRVCLPLKRCSAQEFETTPPTLTTNRECQLASVCDNNVQYESVALSATSNRMCLNLTICGDKQYQSTAQTVTSDRTCTNATVCDISFQYESTPFSEYSDTKCTNLRVCSNTEFESKPPTYSSNRVCTSLTDCTATQYESAPSSPSTDRVCTGLTSCSSSQFISTPATTTTDRKCSLGTTCSNQEYISLEMTQTTDRNCTNLTVCSNSQYESVQNTATTDRTCNLLTTCESYEFESQVPSNDRDRVCSNVSTCLSTEYVELDSTPTTDRVCSPKTQCEQGQFEIPLSNGNRDCQNLTVCNSTTQFQTVAPTVTSDRACGPISSCDAHQFAAVQASRTSDTVCANLTVCNEPVEYESKPATSVSDRICSNTTVCTSDQYQTQDVTSTGDRSCAPLSKCTSTEYVSVNETVTSDRKCQAITNCKQDEYMTKLAGVYNDAECSNLTKCTSVEYVSVQPTNVTDRKCQKLTVCEGYQFESQAATDSSDRICLNGTLCETDQFESKAMTIISDRECSNQTVCSNLQYENVAPTYSTNRFCEDLTVCKPDEFETESATSTSDRKCQVHKKCSATQYQETPGSASNDTVCVDVIDCSALEFEAAEPTKTTQRICEQLTACNATQYESQAPTSTSDRQCSSLLSCGMSQFESKEATSTSDRECQDWKNCTQLQYQVSSGTPLSDTVCARLTFCTQSQYEETAPSPTSDRSCKDVQECGPDAFETVIPTYSTDRECTNYTICPPVETYVVTSPTPTSDRECADVDHCLSNQCVSGRGTCVDGLLSYSCNCSTGFFGSLCECDGNTYIPDGATSCLPYSQCSSSEYESVAPTASTNRQCASTRTCFNNEYEVTSPTATSNRECAPVTSCNAVDDLTELTPPTATSDRACEPIDNCLQLSSLCEHESSCMDDHPTPNSISCNCIPETGYYGRFCTCKENVTFLAGVDNCVELSTCNASEFESQAPTDTTDRICDAITLCSSDEYEVAGPTHTTDRSCASVTLCSDSELEETGPSATSDRVCVPKIKQGVTCPLNCLNGGVCVFTSTETCDGSPVCDCGVSTNSECHYGDFCELKVSGCTESNCRLYPTPVDPLAVVPSDVCTNEVVDMCPPGLRVGDIVNGGNADGTSTTTTMTETANEEIQASSDESSNSAMTSSLIAVGILAILAILVLLFLFVKRQKEEKEDAEHSDINPFFLNLDDEPKEALTGLDPFAAGALPCYQLNDPLWLDFRRANAFDHLYNGNKLMNMSDFELEDTYAILRLLCPSRTTLAVLKDVGNRFCAQEVGKAGSALMDASVIDDSVDFLESAMADVLVERAIDVFAGNPDWNHQNLDECIYSIIDDYVPADNPYLVPSENGTGRCLSSDAFYRSCVEEMDEDVYSAAQGERETAYDMGLAMANVEGDYSLAKGNESEYAIADTLTHEDTYSLAKGDDDEIYGLANAPDNDQQVYDTAGSRAASSEVESNYTLAAGDNDGTYSLASTIVTQRKRESIYSIADNEESTYALADAVVQDTTYGVRNKSGLIVEEDEERVYATAAQEIRRESVYEMGQELSATESVYELGKEERIYDVGEGEARTEAEIDARFNSLRGVEDFDDMAKDFDELAVDETEATDSLDIDAAYNSLARRDDFDEMALEFDQIENQSQYNSLLSREMEMDDMEEDKKEYLEFNG